MLWLKTAVTCSVSHICSSPVHQLILVGFSLATLLYTESQLALALHCKFVLGLFHMNIFYGPRKGEVFPWPKQSHKCPTTQTELKLFWSHLLIWPWLKETCCQAQYKAAENYTSVKLRRAGTALMVKDLPASAGDGRDVGLIPGSERSPGEGSGNPLQYSCPENPMDTRSLWATVHMLAKSWILLSTHTHTHTQGGQEYLWTML